MSFENLSFVENYVEKLIEEIKHYYKSEKLSTIYFGGGTPSLLPSEYFKRILDCFNLDNSAEITVEINPDSTTFEFLKVLKETGINRLSIGIQSFNDAILKSIGRLHDSNTALKTIENAKNSGFKNISLDFIYGLPNQSLNDFKSDLEKAMGLEPQHISLYGLKLEEGTALFETYKKTKKKPANLADEDLQAQMYLCAINTLGKYGFEHYEISNFAQKGYESRHNLNYWNNDQYYGFGIAAHGYVEGIRYSNVCTLDEYLKNPLKKLDKHQVSNKEKLEEEIFLGFRKCEGIDVEKINKKFSVNFEERYKKIIEKFIHSEHLIKTEKGYKLSKEGILLSNNILSEFL